MGIFGIALLVAPAIGPTLGGYLVEYVDWRWIFTINLPIGVIGMLLCLLHPARVPVQAPWQAGCRGSPHLGDGPFLPAPGPQQGADWGWGARETVLLFLVSFFSFVLFIYLELTSENPLLDLRAFKYRRFTLANLMVIVTKIGMFSGLFFLPLFLQSFRGIGAMETGLLMLPGRARLRPDDARHRAGSSTGSARVRSSLRGSSSLPSSPSFSAT